MNVSLPVEQIMIFTWSFCKEIPESPFCQSPLVTQVIVGLVVFLVIQKKTGITQEELRVHLEKENIESRPLWKPMHLQPLLRLHPILEAKLQKPYLKQDCACLLEVI